MTSISEGYHKPLKQLAWENFQRRRTCSSLFLAHLLMIPTLLISWELCVLKSTKHQKPRVYFGELLLPRQPMSERISILQSCCNRLIACQKRCVCGRRLND